MDGHFGHDKILSEDSTGHYGFQIHLLIHKSKIHPGAHCSRGIIGLAQIYTVGYI